MPFHPDDYDTVEDLFKELDPVDVAAIEAMARGAYELNPPPCGPASFNEVDASMRERMLQYASMSWMQLRNEGFRIQREQ